MTTRVAAAPVSTTFETFILDVAQVPLSPAQRVLIRCAYDGVDPGTLQGEEREIARRLFGVADVIPPLARQVMIAICGRGSGKSLITGLRLLFRMLTCRVDMLARGEHAYAPIIAPDMRLALQPLRFALGVARATPSIARRIVGETASSFSIRRDGGQLVICEVFPASSGGSAGRGRTLIEAVLDECCFLRDADSVINDVEIFNSLVPRLTSDAMISMISTPWSTSGLAFSMFESNWRACTNAIAVHAPTVLMRPDDETAARVARERARDPENASRELDASFTALGARDAFDPAAVSAAFRPLPDRASPRGNPWEAHDPSGLTSRDRYGRVRCQWHDFHPDAEPYERADIIDSNGNVVVPNAIQFDESGAVVRRPEPERSKPILYVTALAAIDANFRAGDDFDHIAGELVRDARRAGVRWITSDLYQAASLATACRKAGIKFGPIAITQPLKSRAIARLRALLNARQLIIDLADPLAEQLRRDLLGIQQRITANGVSYDTRRSAQGHGDIASALIAGIAFEIGDDVERELPIRTRVEGSPLLARQRRYRPMHVEDVDF